MCGEPFFLTLVLIAPSFWQEPTFGLGASHLARSPSAWVGLYQHPSSGARAKGLSQSVAGIALVPRLERKEEKKKVLKCIRVHTGVYKSKV